MNWEVWKERSYGWYYAKSINEKTITDSDILIRSNLEFEEAHALVQVLRKVTK